MTTAIDLEIKLAFELTKPEHNKGYREALELGALAIIAEIDPIKASQLRIQKMERLLAEERQTLANYELIKQVKKPEKKQEEVQNTKWLEKYELNKVTMATQVNRKFVEWRKVAENWGIDNAKEAEEKVIEQLKKDGLFGCIVCQKCNTKSQYCSTYRKVVDSYNSCQNWVKV